MARKFLTPIDLGKLEIQNAVVQNLGTAPGTPATGQIYYDTALVRPRVWNGSAWIELDPTWLRGQTNTWTAAQTFNAAITGNNTIALTGTGASSVGGTFTGTALIASGLTGATSASRYVGATTSGAPSTGTFNLGDFAVAQNGAIWVCTTAGSPGTWAQIGASGSSYTTVKANNGTALTQRSTLNFINGTYTTATAVDNASQSDIKFDVTVGTPVSVAFGGSNSNGTGTALALANHQHAGPTHDGSAHSAISLSSLSAPTADLAIGGFKLTNVATPTASTDAATKGYVDNVATGLDVKASVRVASTANVTVTYTATGGTSARGQITAAPNTLDGVSLAANDRILLKDQSTGAQNGIWVVSTLGTGANGVWDRATDFDQDVEVTSGAFTFVSEGTANADSGWVLTTDGTITIGGASGTALTWAQFSGAGQITAGAGLTKTGNTLNVVANANNTIVVNADDITVNRTGTNGAHVPLVFKTGTHASATSIAITHNLGQQFILAQVFETSSGNLVDVDVTCTSTTVTTFTFAVAPTANTYTFVIYG